MIVNKTRVNAPKFTVNGILLEKVTETTDLSSEVHISWDMSREMKIDIE